MDENQEAKQPATLPTRTPPPPGGTYPPPGYSEEQPYRGEFSPGGEPEPHDARPERRAGRITAALALIATGAVLLAQLFVQSIDVWKLIQFTPVFLVLLGLEILLAPVLFRGAKIKYDFLGLLLSAVFIVGCSTVVLIPKYLQQEREYSQTVERLNYELQQLSYERLDGSGLPVDKVEWRVLSYGPHFSADMAVEDILPEHDVQFRVYFSQPHESAQSFAEDSRRVMDLLLDLVPGVDYVSFHDGDITDTSRPQAYHTLWMDSPFQFALPAAELVGRVEVSYYTDYGTFDTLEDYEDFLDTLSEEEGRDYLGDVYYEDGYYFFPDGRVIPEHEDMPPYEEYRVRVEEDEGDL